MLKINKGSQKAAIFAEYVLIITTAALALIMANRYLTKAIKGKAAQVTDNFLGTEHLEQTALLMATGGKQLADQTGFYLKTGLTSSQRYNVTQTNDLPNGARSQTALEAEIRESPGTGFSDATGLTNFQLESLPEYTLEDKEKVMTYVPPFVKAEEGFVNTP